MTNEDRVRFTLRLPPGLMKSLKDEAAQRGLTINALMSGVIWGHVQAAERARKEGWA